MCSNSDLLAIEGVILIPDPALFAAKASVLTKLKSCFVLKAEFPHATQDSGGPGISIYAALPLHPGRIMRTIV